MGSSDPTDWLFVTVYSFVYCMQKCAAQGNVNREKNVNLYLEFINAMW